MKIKTWILTIIIILTMSPSLSHGVGLYDNTVVKIGLYYGNSAKGSYKVGNEPLSIIYNGIEVAYLNSGNSFTADVASVIYTNGTGFGDYKSAYNKAQEFGSNKFVYFDGNSYYPASSEIYETMRVAVRTGSSILIRGSYGDLFAFDSAKEVLISTAGDKISIDDVAYRGKLRLVSNGTQINAINYVVLDEYLKGVVGREMSASWELEALKAQAVVARNFTVMSLTKHSADGFNLCATTHCQVYGGIKSEAASVNRAVEETRGELVYYNGSPIQAYYHSSSGGHTEDNENVWSGTALPYLRGVNDPYTIGYANSDWTVELTGNQIKAAMMNKGVDIGEILDVKATKTSSAGRTIELTVLGSKGTKVFYRDAIRNSISSEALKSTKFTIEKVATGISSEVKLDLRMVNDSNLKQVFTNLDSILKSRYSQNISGDSKYIIRGHGWGHGTGMSQYGAKGMAVAGYGYKDIIKHYFTGVEVR